MNCAVKYDEIPEASPTRDDLINTNIDLVKFIVDKIAVTLPKHIDLDDLVGAAYIGLVKAADRFDSNREVIFRTFAEDHIRGAVLDELRSMDILSRGLRARAKFGQVAELQVINVNYFHLSATIKIPVSAM